MTNEEKRIAIAEACGWVWKKRQGCPWNTCFLFHPETKPRFDGKCHWLGNVVGPFEPCERPSITNNAFGEPSPDYLNDLNAMHEAEKAYILQTVEKSVKFRNFLRDVCCDGPRYEISDSLIWHATAAQRADAFLMTLGKL